MLINLFTKDLIPEVLAQEFHRFQGVNSLRIGIYIRLVPDMNVTSVRVSTTLSTKR